MDEPTSPKKSRSDAERPGRNKRRNSSASTEWKSVRIAPGEDTAESNLLAVRVMVLSDESSSDTEDSTDPETSCIVHLGQKTTRFRSSVDQSRQDHGHSNACKAADALERAATSNKPQRWKRIQSVFPIISGKKSHVSRESSSSPLSSPDDEVFCNPPEFSISSAAMNGNGRVLEDRYLEVPAYVPHHKGLLNRISPHSHQEYLGDETTQTASESLVGRRGASEKVMRIPSDETLQNDGAQEDILPKSQVLKKLVLSNEEKSSLLDWSIAKQEHPAEKRGPPAPPQVEQESGSKGKSAFSILSNAIKKSFTRSVSSAPESTKHENKEKAVSPSGHFDKSTPFYRRSRSHSQRGPNPSDTEMYSMPHSDPQNEHLRPPRDNGLLYPRDNGLLYPRDNGLLYPRDNGLLYPRDNGLLYPRDNGLLYPRDNGLLYPRDNGLLYPRDNGLLYPRDNGPLYPPDTGLLYPGASKQDSSVNSKAEDFMPRMMENCSLKENHQSGAKQDFPFRSRKNSFFSSLRLKKSENAVNPPPNETWSVFSSLRRKGNEKETGGKSRAADTRFPSPSPHAGSQSNGGRMAKSEDCGSSSDDEELKQKRSSSFKSTRTSKHRKKMEREVRQKAKQEELKRLHKAQTIQRQLQEVEEKQRALERQGVKLEKALRGEADSGPQDEPQLLHEWFQLALEKHKLSRYESDLLSVAKELDLEDQQSRLEQKLRERMLVDPSLKGEKDVAEEQEIFAEMMRIVEQRDRLVTHMEEQRLRQNLEEEKLYNLPLLKEQQMSVLSNTRVI